MGAGGQLVALQLIVWGLTMALSPSLQEGNSSRFKQLCLYVRREAVPSWKDRWPHAPAGPSPVRLPACALLAADRLGPDCAFL
jgi:hypothetical protein